MKWKVRLRGARHAEALRRAPERLERELDRAAGRGALEFSRDVRRDAPKAESTLASSVTVRRQGSGRYLVIVGAAHGIFVEHGRGPGGMPPVQSIADWISVRGITPDDSRMSQRDLAFVIARSIARGGTRAQPFFEPNLPGAERRLEQLVDAGTERALA